MFSRPPTEPFELVPDEPAPALQGARGTPPTPGFTNDFVDADAAQFCRSVVPYPAVRKPSLRFMRGHPAHWIALGFGSGLSRFAPGTAGTLWAWAAFVVLAHWLNDADWAVVLGVSLLVGWWACSVTARNLGTLDPRSVVWDEVVGFWLVLWLVMPTGLAGQFAAFLLFRFFDAVKPGPVGWADRWCHGLQPDGGRLVWAQAGLGILWDDLVAAACTLLVIALWRFAA